MPTPRRCGSPARDRPAGQRWRRRSRRGRKGTLYRKLDDAAALAAADPNALVGQPGAPHVVDDAPRVFDLFPAIKPAVDRQRQPGRYLLAGFADVLPPRLAESIAGRMPILTLEPTAQSELAGDAGSAIDRRFDGNPDLDGTLDRSGGPGLPERVAGVEIKASSTLRNEGLAGRRVLPAQADQHGVGVVRFYTGDAMLPFGKGLHGVPVDRLGAGPGASRRSAPG